MRQVILWVALCLFMAAPCIAQCTDCDDDTFAYPGDCDDGDDTIFPGAPELCDGRDNDCNGQIDENPSCDRTCDLPDREGLEIRVSSKPFLPELSSLGPSLVWTGSQYGFGWTDLRNSGAGEVYFALAGSDGTKIPTGGVCDTTTPTCNPTTKRCKTGPPSIIGVRVCSVDSDCYSCSAPAGREADACTVDGHCDDVRITNDAAFSSDPVIAWTGEEFGIVWIDERNSGAGEIYFARVGSDGTKISDTGVCDTTTPTCDTANGLCATGPAPIIGVVTCSIDSDCYSCAAPAGREGDACTVDSDCDDDVRITNTAGVCDIPDQASIGTCTAGRVGATCFANIDCHASPTAPDIAWNGQEFGVAWYDERDQNREIYFARIDAGGVKIGGDLRVTNDGGRSMEPSLVWNGTEYGIAWQDDRTDQPADPPRREIYFTRLGFTTDDPAEIEVIGGDVRITEDAAFSSAPSLAWSGTEYGIAWHDSRHGTAEIYFARVGATGMKIGDDLRVTDDPAYSLSADLSWTGEEYGVTWQDDRMGNREIYFSRLGSDSGNIVKMEGDVRLTHLQHAATPNSSSSPRIVWTGSEYGVAWEDNGDITWEIYFARVPCDCTDSDGDLASECSDCNEDALFGANIFPGADDVCDGFDTDCSESSLESAPDNPLELDTDHDGYISCDDYVENGAGFSGGGDCDDDAAKISPGEEEICDGFDTDCSGGAAPAADDPLERDLDGDGYIGCDPYVENGAGLLGGGDCDGADKFEFPGQVWYPNCDGDFAYDGTPVVTCSIESADALTPCDDGLPPEATAGTCKRICSVGSVGANCTVNADCGVGANGVCAPLQCVVLGVVGRKCVADNDCRWINVAGADCNDEDATVNQIQTWHPDCDGDGGFATNAQSKSVQACGPAGADLVSSCDGGVPPIGGWRTPNAGNDCEDENPEEFNGQVWYPDCDGDGSFHPALFHTSCREAGAIGQDFCGDGERPDGGWIHVAGDDCDDTDASAFPGAQEICSNGVDEDCDGLVDDDPGVCDTGAGMCTAGAVGASCGSDDECFACIVVTPPVTTPPEVVDLSLAGTLVNWQTVPSMPAYNVYRGDVTVLRETGAYTQDPSTVPLAASMCGLLTTPEDDPYTPPVGQVVFYLVAADNGAAEGILGMNSTGIVRANQHPCP